MFDYRLISVTLLVLGEWLYWLISISITLLVQVEWLPVHGCPVCSTEGRQRREDLQTNSVRGTWWVIEETARRKVDTVLQMRPVCMIYAMNHVWKMTVMITICYLTGLIRQFWIKLGQPSIFYECSAQVDCKAFRDLTPNHNLLIDLGNIFYVSMYSWKVLQISPKWLITLVTFGRRQLCPSHLCLLGIQSWDNRYG